MSVTYHLALPDQVGNYGPGFGSVADAFFEAQILVDLGHTVTLLRAHTDAEGAVTWTPRCTLTPPAPSTTSTRPS